MPPADIAWLRPDGDPMSDEDWSQAYAKAIGVFLNGEEIAEPDEHGRRVVGDSLLLLLNAADHTVDFTLPSAEIGEAWRQVISTAEPGASERDTLKAGDRLPVEARALVVLQRLD